MLRPFRKVGDKIIVTERYYSSGLQLFYPAKQIIVCFAIAHRSKIYTNILKNDKKVNKIHKICYYISFALEIF